MRTGLSEMTVPWEKASNVPGMFGEASATAFFIIMRTLRPRTVVEIGSYLGKSTIFLAESLQALRIDDGMVHSIDPHTGDRQQMKALGASRAMSAQGALFRDHLMVSGQVERVIVHCETSASAVVVWDGTPIDFLYIDGWHSYDEVTSDGENWIRFLDHDGVVVFDDYARYAEVRSAVDDLARRKVFAYWGTVFGQAVGGATGSHPPLPIRQLIEHANSRLLRRVFRVRDL